MHRMQLPREIVVGNNTLDLIGEICKHLGFESSLMVAGHRTLDTVGKKVISILNGDGINVVHCLASSTNIEDIEFVKQRIKEIKPHVVLGVGGGAKIDIAKISSADMKVPFISIPTNAAHDGIVSPLVSLKGLGSPYSLMAQAPMAIVADTNIIIHSSYRFTASGCADVIAKLTSVRDWKLAHEVKNEYYGEYAASLAQMSARLVLRNADLIKPNAETGLRVLIEALISCGVAMSIARSSRPCSGSEHLFSHALDQIAPKPALHGEQCGVGTIMMARLHNIDWREIKKMLAKVGAPTNAQELGIEPKHVVEALVKAGEIRTDRYTILNEKILDYHLAEKLARATGVI